MCIKLNPNKQQLNAVNVTHVHFRECIIKGFSASCFTNIPQKKAADRCISHLTDSLTQLVLCCLNAASSDRAFPPGSQQTGVIELQCPVSRKRTPLCRHTDVTQPFQRTLLCPPSSHLSSDSTHP